MLYFGDWQDRESVGSCPMANSPLTTGGARSFKAEFQGSVRGGRGYMHSPLYSYLEAGHWVSDQSHLVVSSAVSIPFQGWLIPTSLRPSLGIVAAQVKTTV